MPLRYDAKKGETLHISGIRMQFTSDAQILFLDQVDIMSSRMMINELEADTPLKIFYLEVQNAYTRQTVDKEIRNFDLARKWKEVEPLVGSDPALADIAISLSQGNCYKVMKSLWNAIDATQPSFWDAHAERVRRDEAVVRDFKPRHTRR
jgi:hypothetical protein